MPGGTPILDVQEQLTRLLVCPACHGSLQWVFFQRRGDRIQEGKAICGVCRSDYPVHQGIAVFLTTLPKPEDLWNEADTEIASFLKSEPERARRLMEAPLESLNPTDQLVRGFVLEARKDFVQAKNALDRANHGMYTAQFRAASRSQTHYVKERLAVRPGPVVDLASGMGSLLESLLPDSTQQFIGTDVSTRVLLRDQEVFDHFGLGSRLSFLAFDARHTPFADGSLPSLVSNVGLANIENPGDLLEELRRVVSGEFLAISIFYPEDGGPNSEMIHRLNLDSLLYRESALRHFHRAGFEVEVCNMQKATARPTPRGEIMNEVQPDRLPVSETEVEWCTLVAC